MRESLKAEEKADFAASILQSVDDASFVIRHSNELVDPKRPATIHRMRVELKKFRCIPKNFRLDSLKRMNDYLSLMGEIQDMEIFIQAMDDFQTNASSFDIEPVHRYYESRHTDAISTRLKDKDMLNDFWRLAPEGSFPWEKTE